MAGRMSCDATLSPPSSLRKPSFRSSRKAQLPARTDHHPSSTSPASQRPTSRPWTSVPYVNLYLASVASTKYLSKQFAYGPSKAGLNHLTSQLAAHFARHGLRIRCNAIMPGAFPSEIAGPEVFEPIKTVPLPGYVAAIPSKSLGSYVVSLSYSDISLI